MIVVVLEDGIHPAYSAELANAFALFRNVKGVARSEDDGVFEVEIPMQPHEPLWEALRRLEIRFEERP